MWKKIKIKIKIKKKNKQGGLQRERAKQAPHWAGSPMEVSKQVPREHGLTWKQGPHWLSPPSALPWFYCPSEWSKCGWIHSSHAAAMNMSHLTNCGHACLGQVDWLSDTLWLDLRPRPSIYCILSMILVLRNVSVILRALSLFLEKGIPTSTFCLLSGPWAALPSPVTSDLGTWRTRSRAK